MSAPAVGQRRSCAGAVYDIIAESTLIVGWFRVRWLASGTEDEYPGYDLETDEYLGPTPSPTHATPGPVDVVPSSSTGPGGSGDRSKCRPWCGLQYEDRRVPVPIGAVGCDVGMRASDSRATIPGEKSSASRAKVSQTGVAAESVRAGDMIVLRADGSLGKATGPRELTERGRCEGFDVIGERHVRCGNTGRRVYEQDDLGRRRTRIACRYHCPESLPSQKPIGKPEPTRLRHPAGITCRQCLVTSHGGEHHLVGRDVAGADAIGPAKYRRVP